MFVKVIRKDAQGNMVDTIINTERVIATIEKHIEPTRLYDECGELVETKEPDHKEYLVLLDGGKQVRLLEDEFVKLEKVLLA